MSYRRDAAVRARARRRDEVGIHAGALPNSHSKEDFSLAYAHALAAAIGVDLDVPRRDINGCDANFRSQDTATETAAQLSVQLKCTVNRLARVEQGRELSFPLPADDYTQLTRPTYPPRILVVVEIPSDDPRRWFDVAPRTLAMFGTAWWVSLVGGDPLPAGQDTKNVRLPVGQRFTPAALNANMRSFP